MNFYYLDCFINKNKIVNMENSDKTIGVIVGRFQVSSLHKGHINLFEQIAEKFDYIFVVLGLTKNEEINERNMYSYKYRFHMIQDCFTENEFVKNKIINITKIKDVGDPEFWSQQLDIIIEEFTNKLGFQEQNIFMTGSRDSFLKTYSGSFKQCYIEPIYNISGSEVRVYENYKKTLNKDENPVSFEEFKNLFI